MSIKGWLMPPFAEWLTGEARLDKRRERAEAKRRRQGRPHEVVWYHRADDPYSYLLAQALTRLVDSYEISLVCRTVPPPVPGAAPEPEKLAAWSLRDSAELSRYMALDFPEGAAQPAPEIVERAQMRLTWAERRQEDYLTYALEQGAAIWSGGEVPEPAAPPLKVDPSGRLEANQATLHAGGHYLSGVLYYEGEWYWGVDRIVWLAERLEALGAGSGQVVSRRPGRPDFAGGEEIEFWLSARSPYSYLALERVFALGERYAVPVRVRPVLPMVLRGLPVPRSKRMYIVYDAKREAIRNGIPFGRICDPLPAVERVLAIVPRARAAGLEQAYLRAAMGGAWARGLDLTTDRDLRSAVEAAGLTWDDARAALADDAWRAEAEANREALFAMGLWGVPSFRYGGWSAWGQDRIWMLEEKLRAARG